MTEYIPSIKGTPKGITHLPDFTHSGKILTMESWRARCQCGFCGPLRKYPYEASDDLLLHFRRSGTFVEEEPEDDGHKRAKSLLQK